MKGSDNKEENNELAIKANEYMQLVEQNNMHIAKLKQENEELGKKYESINNQMAAKRKEIENIKSGDEKYAESVKSEYLKTNLKDTTKVDKLRESYDADVKKADKMLNIASFMLKTFILAPIAPIFAAISAIFRIKSKNTLKKIIKNNGNKVENENLIESTEENVKKELQNIYANNKELQEMEKQSEMLQQESTFILDNMLMNTRHQDRLKDENKIIKNEHDKVLEQIVQKSNIKIDGSVAKEGDKLPTNINPKNIIKPIQER
ncbi:MAG: hypothetical protein J0H68_08520 [Sphingobacteriia bacterium]|nr:hypothetical protein [Sphingobacteriia bacterium]